LLTAVFSMFPVLSERIAVLSAPTDLDGELPELVPALMLLAAVFAMLLTAVFSMFPVLSERIAVLSAPTDLDGELPAAFIDPALAMPLSAIARSATARIKETARRKQKYFLTICTPPFFRNKSLTQFFSICMALRLTPLT